MKPELRVSDGGLKFLEGFAKRALKRYATRVNWRRLNYPIDRPYVEKTIVDDKQWKFECYTDPVSANVVWKINPIAGTELQRNNSKLITAG